MDLKKILEKFFKDQLSEEAMTEIETLFQAEIAEGVKKGVEAKEAELEESNAAEMKKFKAELVDKLSEYTKVAVGEFIQENAPAIESDIKVNISETVIKSLMGVLKEQYINVPEGETDVVADLEKKNADLTEKLNGAINSDIESKKQILEYEKALCFKKMIAESDLTDKDAESVLDLMEGIEADSIEAFEEKTKIIIAKVKEDLKEAEEDEDLGEDLNEKVEDDVDGENLNEKESEIDQYLP